MKILFLLFLTFSLCKSSSEWSCETCTAVVNTLAWTNLESLDSQIDIILSEVCPNTVDAEACAAIWPGLWTKLGSFLWPAYYNPKNEQMCGVTGLCGKSDFRDLSCEECVAGVRATQAIIMGWHGQGFWNWVLYANEGPHLCESEEDPGLCEEHVNKEVGPAVHAINEAAMDDETFGPHICNIAVPGICPGYL